MLSLISKIKEFRKKGLIILFLLFSVIIYGNLSGIVINRHFLGEKTTEEANAMEPVQADVPTEVATAKPEPERQVLWAPLSGQVQQGKGWVYSPLYSEWYYHNGQDLVASPDQLVQACMAGTVKKVSTGPNGLTVEIESNKYKIIYASLSETYLKTGQSVQQGQALGKPGRSDLEPFNHVHMEVFYDQENIEAF